MSSPCVYCHWNLPPGEQQCPRCGRWQPPVSQPQPAQHGPDDGWDQPGQPDFQPGPAYPQGDYRQGESPEYWSYPGRRPPGQDFAAPRPPGRQGSLALKILIGVLVVMLVGLGSALAVVLAQGGHAAPQQQTTLSSTPGQTSTTVPTATPSPGVTPTPVPNVGHCTAHGGAPLSFKGAPQIMFVYDQLLPANLPLKPLTRAQAHPSGSVTTENNILLAVQINLPSGSQSITVCQMTLKLTAFKPLNGSVPNVLNSCSGVYLDPGGPQGGGCGGGFSSDGSAAITFSSTKVGATVQAAVKGQNNQPAKVTASSQGAGTISATIKVTTPGTYTFSVGLWQDTSGPKFDSQAASEMILLRHISHYWGSQPCTTSAMQKLLPPPSNPPGEYICPGGPPQS